MGLTRFGVLALGACLLCLSGCLGRADLTSEIEFLDADNPQQIVDRIRPALFAHAEDLGGVCKTSTRGSVCRFPNRQTADATDIQIGLSEITGNAYLSVHTASTYWLPKSPDRMRNGDLIPDFHKKWEHWAVDATSQFEPQVRTRMYSDLGEIGEF